MNQEKLALFARIGELFMRYGIKALTMDDIAKHLKVSKKTLYKFVADKSDLVNQVMKIRCDVECFLINDIHTNSENAIDEIIQISQNVSQQLQQVHPSLHYDLEKYYPEAWGTFNAHKKSVVLHFIENNLIRGISEGIYRENLSSKIIARLFVQKIDVLFDPEVFPPSEISFKEAHSEMIRYHIRGIANDKGVKYMKTKLKKEAINLFNI
jgi:TetR/AcrR family transcriptional regulator, cholesterol catabolism regulator